MAKDFAVFDNDSFELATLWERYLEPEYRTLGKHTRGAKKAAPAFISSA